MFGCWILVIIFAALLAIGIILWIVGNKTCEEWAEVLGGCLTIFCALLCLIFVFISLILPIQAEVQYREFEITKAIVTEAIENGTETENYAITQTIIEANKWYAEAKASKEKWGNWSRYYKLDFDSIEPISIGR